MLVFQVPKPMHRYPIEKRFPVLKVKLNQFRFETEYAEYKTKFLVL